MWIVAQVLATVAGTLSLLMLFKQGFALGFVTPFEAMLDFYRQFVEALLGWAQLPLMTLVNDIGQLIGISLHLYPHWKHILIPMWLYFSADASANWRRGRRGACAFVIVWGGLVAIISSIGASTVEINESNLISLIFPVAGFILYDVVENIWVSYFYPFGKNTQWQTFGSVSV